MALFASWRETSVESGDDENDNSAITQGILKTWSRLLFTLMNFFRLSHIHSSTLNPLEYLKPERDNSTVKGSQRELVFRRMYEKITTVMKELLGMMDKDEMSQILEELSEMV